MRAGTTQRHVSFIETGRSVPGRSMIIRLAESLEVPIRERNELLLAAGSAPAYPHSDLDDPRLAPVRAALERVLRGHLPYPAVIVDRQGDLVSANAGFHLLTHFGTATDVTIAELRLEAFLPADEATSTALTELVTW